jgi:hypothetical protein
MSSNGIRKETTDNRRSWVLVGAWFGTIALVGLLKRILQNQRPF